MNQQMMLIQVNHEGDWFRSPPLSRRWSARRAFRAPIQLKPQTLGRLRLDACCRRAATAWHVACA